MRTGKAIVFEKAGCARVQTLQFPDPTPGMLRIAVKMSGVCHREWNVITGKLARTFPAVMGHEPVGVVDAIGEGVVGFSIGESVTGVGTSSLAAFDLVDARYMAPLRGRAFDSVKLGEPAMCAVNAVNRIVVPRNPIILVNGLGFMGSLLIQALRAKIEGAVIVGIDPVTEQRVEALSEGANEVFGSIPEAKNSFKRVDVAFEASGAVGTIGELTSAVRNGGTLALFAHHFQIEPQAVNDWHLRGISVLNTVPWSAPDLAKEVREGVGLLNCDLLKLRQRMLRVVPPEHAAEILSRGPEPLTKLIVSFE